LPLSAPTTPAPVAPRMWLDEAAEDTNCLPRKMKCAVEDEVQSLITRVGTLLNVGCLLDCIIFFALSA